MDSNNVVLAPHKCSNFNNVFLSLIGFRVPIIIPNW